MSTDGINANRVFITPDIAVAPDDLPVTLDERVDLASVVSDSDL